MLINPEILVLSSGKIIWMIDEPKEQILVGQVAHRSSNTCHMLKNKDPMLFLSFFSFTFMLTEQRNKEEENALEKSLTSLTRVDSSPYI